MYLNKKDLLNILIKMKLKKMLKVIKLLLHVLLLAQIVVLEIHLLEILMKYIQKVIYRLI